MFIGCYKFFVAGVGGCWNINNGIMGSGLNNSFIINELLVFYRKGNTILGI